MDELTDLDHLILSALSTAEWRNRVIVARNMKQDYTMNQYDIKRLERLVVIGRVEKRNQPISKARTVYEYRLVQS